MFGKLKKNLINNQQKKALQEGFCLYFNGKLGGDITNGWENWNQEIGNLCEMLADIIFIEKKNATIWLGYTKLDKKIRNMV